MNPVLETKLEELKNAKDYECWYLVKQPTAFDNLCYLVSFLKEFQEARQARQPSELYQPPDRGGQQPETGGGDLRQLPGSAGGRLFRADHHELVKI